MCGKRASGEHILDGLASTALIGMMRAAILGSGKAGSDLLAKLAQSRILVPGPFVGRDAVLAAGRGDCPSTDAGNLDLVNGAAIAMAEAWAGRMKVGSVSPLQRRLPASA